MPIYVIIWNQCCGAGAGRYGCMVPDRCPNCKAALAPPKKVANWKKHLWTKVFIKNSVFLGFAIFDKSKAEKNYQFFGLLLRCITIWETNSKYCTIFTLGDGAQRRRSRPKTDRLRNTWVRQLKTSNQMIVDEMVGTHAWTAVHHVMAKTALYCSSMPLNRTLIMEKEKNIDFFRNK